ncbi:MAG TPA: APC family permease [Gemmataceae bacterium]|jgi:amino acid transporter|nr:APC family permease [Gemmataceae bacterium]
MIHTPTLTRGLGLWQATAVNITQIVGAGVFATIPLILGVLPGPYALLAWLVAGVLILCDSLIWGELGAAMPAAGGSYHFLLESFGRSRWGRLMAFLFVWQILISGPLEVGSGLVAAAQFSTAFPKLKQLDEEYTRKIEVTIDVEEKPGATPDDPPVIDKKVIGLAFGPTRLLGLILGLTIIALLYRRVTTLGRLSVIFVVGVFAVLGWVLIEGAIHFDPKVAFDTSVAPGEWKESFGLSLGAGMGLAIFSYFGYYNICYLGAEVREPARTIPRSILLSALIVVVLFTLVHLAIVGFIPWREAAKETDNLTAEFMMRARGEWARNLVTLLLIGSCFASCFSGMLGYSRVPYAAATEGHFFRWFAAVHPRLHIPHRALLLIGAMVLFWSFFTLGDIINALIATRILEQFVAQAIGVMLVRRLQKNRPRPWKMWLYPLPCLVALVGWLFVYYCTGRLFVVIGLTTLAVGLIVFVIWALQRLEWPFDNRLQANAQSKL